MIFLNQNILAHLIPPSTILYAFRARLRPRRHRNTAPIISAILPTPHSSNAIDTTTFATTAIRSNIFAPNGSGSKFIKPLMACGGHNIITTLIRDNSPKETISQPIYPCSSDLSTRVRTLNVPFVHIDLRYGGPILKAPATRMYWKQETRNKTVFSYVGLSNSCPSTIGGGGVYLKSMIKS
jgi:hypothetical protein